MFRNIKISVKLYLGFTIILLVFIGSVFVLWSYIKVVDEGSDFLAKRIVPVLYMITEFNNEINGTFLATRSLQYTENQDAITKYKEQLAKTQKVQGEFISMNKEFPTLATPAHIVNKVVPVENQYVDIVNRTLDQIAKKHTLLEELVTDGLGLSDLMKHLMNTLHTHLGNSIRDMSYGTDKSTIIALESGLFLTSEFLEEVMGLRRDTWHAIAIIQTGGGVDNIRELVKTTGDFRKQAEGLRQFFNQEEQKELNDLLHAFDEYADTLERFMKACTDVDKLHQDRAPLLKNLTSEVDAAAGIALDRVKNVSESNSNNLRWVIYMMIGATIFTFILSIAIGFLTARSISKPLTRIVSLAKRAGDGDLTIKKSDFGYEGRDEMGSMVEAIAHMMSEQSNTLTRIVEIADHLASEAGDLSAISEETNAAMEEIKASVFHVSELSESNGTALEQSNVGVEEMSAGADTVATSATDSAAFISQTTDTSNKAIQTVQNVIVGMHDVNKNAKESEDKIRQLVSSVENVSSFVSVITRIADQTNLLALNAAIEAARAGEVGRGFAVVAEEVRKLAEESARAAESVNVIIQELQAGAHESIKATSEAGRLLVLTLDHADQALDELNGALAKMNKANDSIQNIAAVAEEQAASSREVAHAIDNAVKGSLELTGTISNIMNATNETSQATEGVAKEAASMTNYANTLSEILSHFTLENAMQPIKAKMLNAK